MDLLPAQGDLRSPASDSLLALLVFKCFEPVVARVLYLSYEGSFSNERGLPPLVPHYNQRFMGGDIDRHHEARLTWD